MIAYTTNFLVAVSVWPDLILMQPWVSCTLGRMVWELTWATGHSQFANRQFGHGQSVLEIMRVYLCGGEVYCTIWSQRRSSVSFTSIYRTDIWNTCPASRVLGTVGKGTVLLWWKYFEVLYLFGRTVFKPSKVLLDGRPIWVPLGHWNSIFCCCLGPVSC